jgi:hypothetical protein
MGEEEIQRDRAACLDRLQLQLEPAGIGGVGESDGGEQGRKEAGQDQTVVPGPEVDLLAQIDRHEDRQECGEYACQTVAARLPAAVGRGREELARLLRGGMQVLPPC